MNCLRPEEIHRYLEDEMEFSEARNVKRHLAACGKCREAFEEREILMKAVHGMPDIEIPGDFAVRIMERVPHAKEPALGWLAAFLVGVPVSVGAGFIYLLASGQSLAHDMVGGGKNMWSGLKDATLFFVKLMKLAGIAIHLFVQFAGRIFETIANFAHHVDPAALGGGMVILLAATTLFVFGIRKKIYPGEEP